MASKFFAQFYDRMVQGMEKTHFSAVRKILLPNIDGNLLEIGTGTGANIPYLPQGGKKIFLEYNPWMLRQALKKSLREQGEPLLGSSSALPFRDKSFDTVLVTLVLCSVGDLPMTVSEIARVLKPDGRVLILEHVKSEKMWMAALQRTITPIWKHLADGCHLDRDIGGTLQKEFKKVEQRSFTLQHTPFIYGIYEKINDR
jgi:ubiquinone/menaquinone biosynthesis C-methylase UbiE